MFSKFKSNIIYRGFRYYFRKIKEFFRTIFFQYYFASDYNKLKSLKNKHLNKPCVVIGNGPSINKMNLEKLNDYVTIACNGFFYKMDQISWSPTYYTVEDPFPAEDNKEIISNLKESIKIIPTDLKKYIKPSNNTIYCNFRRSYLRPFRRKFPKFSFNFPKESFWGGTVTYFNLQLATHLGCNPIYLIGVDLNYKIKDDIVKSGNDLLSVSDDINHFDPRYFGEGKRWHIPETERMQKSLAMAYDYMKKKKFKLFNAGLDSKLKEVPKINIKAWQDI